MDISRTLGDTVITAGGIVGSGSKVFHTDQELEQLFQVITLDGNDEQNCYVVNGRDVKVVVSSDDESVKRDRIGSSKVKISPVVNYDWEHKFYVGNLVAVHLNRTHVAYVLKSKSGGIVRIINRRTAERVLLNGFTESRVVDISFAYMSRVILGVTDQLGSFYVYEITEADSGKLHCFPKFQCLRPASGPKSDYHRLIWCLYVPEEDEDEQAGLEEDEESLMCLLTHDEKAVIWNVALVSQLYGAEPVTHAVIKSGLHVLNYHSKPIIDAAFSPDGGAVATASLDGSVKFFEIKLSSDVPPTFMHNLLPHGGKPLSCLFFLDNHKHPNSGDKFWRYAVTGADNNTELKIWNCEYWTCAQTLTFTLPPQSSPLISPMSAVTSPPKFVLKHCVDLSSTYLILSDIHRSVIYILQLQQGTGPALICALSEFLLTQSYLSLAVLDAGRHKLNRSTEQHWTLNGDDAAAQNDENDEVEVEDDSEGPGITAVVKLFAIQARAMQELQIRYMPPSSAKYQPSSISSASETTLVTTAQDLLSDVSFTSDIFVEASDCVGYLKSALHKPDEQAGDCSLSSPDVFTSPSKHVGVAQAARGSGSAGSSLTLVSALHEEEGDSYKSTARDLKLSHQKTSSVDDPLLLASIKASQLVTEQIERSMNEVADEMTDDPVDRSNSRHRRHRASWSNSSSESTSLEVTEILENVEKSNHSVEGSMLEHDDDDKANDDDDDNSGNDGDDNDSEADDEDEEDDNNGGDESEDIDLQGIAIESRMQDDVPYFEDDVDDDDTVNDIDEESEENKADLSRCDDSKEDEIIIEEVKEEDVESGQDELRNEQLISYANHNNVTLEDIVLARDGSMNRDRSAENLLKSGSSLLASAAMDLPTITRSPDVSVCSEKSAKNDTLIVLENKTTDDTKINKNGAEIVSDAREENSLSNVNNTNQLLPARGQNTDVTSSHIRLSSNPSQAMERKQEEPQALRSAVSLTIKPEASVQQTNRHMLDSIVGLLKSQQKEVSELREEVQRMREHGADTDSHMTRRVSGLSAAIDSNTLKALEEHKHKQNELINSLVRGFESHSAERQQKVVEAVESKLEKEVTSQLKTLIKESMTSTLAPHITQILEPMKEKLQVELTRKLSSTDALLKENLSKLSKSKQLTDGLSQAITVSFQESLQATCHNTFLPLFDQYCRNLVQDLGTTINGGASQYQQKWNEAEVKRERQLDKINQGLTGLMDSVQRDHNSQSKAREQLQSVVESLRASAAAKSSAESANQRAASSAVLDKVIREQFDRLSKDLVVKVKAIINDELAARLGEQQVTISEQLHQAIEHSRAASPVNQSQTDLRASHQRQILALIEANKINAAFEKALSVHDSTLADFICSKLDPASVFSGEPCPLSQIVILSLIQHLSIGLSQNSELKYRYLEEAITALDQNTAVTRENMGKVLLQLRVQLTAYIQAADKNDVMLRPMTKLLKICEIILKSVKLPSMR